MLRNLPVLFLTLFTLCLGTRSVQAQTVVEVIANSENHTTLESAIIAAELNTALSGTGPFTVFAPTDAAFEMLPEGYLEFLLMEANKDSLASVLSYHVVPGDTTASELMDGMMLPTLVSGDSLFVRLMGEMVHINGAMVTMADIDASNGTVHVIDMVLTQPAASVVDVIMTTDTLSTLATAIEEAELEDALMMEGPYTIFAPANDAFSAIDQADLAALLADPDGDLTDILQYHVVAGTYTSADFTDGMMLMTLQGEELEISVMNDTILIDTAMVIMSDMMADNGIVHVINGVLMPEAVTSAGEPEFAKDVMLAPNPASSVLNVTLPQSIAGKAMLTLRDFNGRTVLTRRSAGERQPLDIGNLPAGTYLLEVRADAGVIQRKIMVQR